MAAPACRNVEYGLVMQELERGDSGVRSFVSVQSALCMYPIYTFGSEEQKRRGCPPAEGRKAGLLRADGARLWLEPRRHAHPRQKVGNEYVLNGEKMWITSGTIADVAVIWAKVEDEEDKSAASWSKPTVPDSRRTTFTASGRCAPR